MKGEGVNGVFQPLLGDNLAPLLQDLAFVHAERDEVVRAWLEFSGPLLRAHGVEYSSTVVQGSLEQVVRQLEPLSMPTRERYLFIPCKNNWTLVRDNGVVGSDAVSLLHGTVSRTRQQGVRLCVNAPLDAERRRRQIRSVIWEVFEVGDGIAAKSRRSLAVQKTSSWHWVSTGNPLVFEDTAAYSAKKIGDRFTPEMLDRYAQAMGIDAFNEKFYLTESRGAVLLHLSHVPFPNQTNRSLADVQRELALKRSF